MPRLSRRGLLRGAAGLAVGYWAGRFFPEDCYPVYADELEAPSVVVAEGTNEDSPEVLLRTALAPLGGIERFVKPGQTVAIKPNATWDKPPHTASSTDPDLLRALINMVKAAGAAQVIVMDRSVFDPPALVLDVSGIGAILEETGVVVHVLDRFVEPPSKYVEIEIPDGRAFQRMGVIKAAVEADVRINMAVAKTHIVTPLTLCCKHMMGFLENPAALHVSLDQGIADICTAPGIKPALHILEAIRVRVAGAAYGTGTDVTDPVRVKRMNQVIAGTDPVLIDSYATGSFFKLSPMEVTHIKRAFETNAGEIDVQAAMASGRLRSYRPEDIKPTPTFTATATATPLPTVPGEPTATATPILTPTLMPTATPVPAPCVRMPADGILDINPLLDAPLVPLAAIIGGVGIVVGRRLASSLPPAAGKHSPDGTGEDDGDARRGRRQARGSGER